MVVGIGYSRSPYHLFHKLETAHGGEIMKKAKNPNDEEDKTIDKDKDDKATDETDLSVEELEEIITVDLHICP